MGQTGRSFEISFKDHLPKPSISDFKNAEHIVKESRCLKLLKKVTCFFKYKYYRKLSNTRLCF